MLNEKEWDDALMSEEELDQVAGGRERTYMFIKAVMDGKTSYTVSHLSDIPGCRSQWIHQRVPGEEWEKFKATHDEAKFVELYKGRFY